MKTQTKQTYMPTIHKIAQRLYTQSPWDLSSENDVAYCRGVDYALNDSAIMKCLNMHDELKSLLEKAVNNMGLSTNPIDEKLSLKIIRALDKAENIDGEYKDVDK